MWRGTAGIVALLLAHETVLTGFGQDRSDSPLPSQCPSVRFELVMGRLTALHLNAGQSRTSRGSDTDDETRETMQVHSEGPAQIVRYDRQSSTQRITIEFTNGSRVSMIKEPLLDREKGLLELQQFPNGQWKVALGTGEQKRTWSASSFWHLLLAEPQLCQKEIVPLLKLLRPSWDFSDVAERLETALYRAAHSGEVVTRTHLAELVNELGHQDFQRRQAADQQIRSHGPSVLPFLSTLDATALNGEQRQRIRQIREHMLNAAPDTPERIAHWLVDDERVWITLLAHPDGEKRHLAALRLMQIHPDMLSFDPYGDEQYRQAQLAQLKVALLR